MMLNTDSDSFYVPTVNTPIITFEFDTEQRFDCFKINEVIELGHRIRGYAVDIWENDGWKTICEKQCVGYQWAERFPEKKTNKVRLRIIKAVAPPVIRFFGIYHLPEGIFEDDNEIVEKENIFENGSAKLIAEENSTLVQLGGIFPYNTIVFHGLGMWEYTIEVFDGAKFNTVYSGNRPSREEICRIPIQKTSYQFRITGTGGKTDELMLGVYMVS